MIPVKPLQDGKSRLGAPGAARAELALAIALDTIAAVAAAGGVGEVVVVTADDAVADAVGSLSCGVGVLACSVAVRIVREPRAAGIDAALALAAGIVGSGVPRASLPGDLAALRPEELASALRLAGEHDRAVVADADGTGTTLLTARTGVAWRSAYGPGSFARHIALGAHALALPADSGLRRDLDTPAQLAAAAASVGPRTAAAVGLAGVAAPA
ncbi:MAG: 2-phospho-L-lactate guanylyltransferase [Microbacterium sp.]|nr:MAG: 2-phospho-L-lactate guanylyltransferase [Microbacterium sp.]